MSEVQKSINTALESVSYDVVKVLEEAGINVGPDAQHKLYEFLCDNISPALY